MHWLAFFDVTQMNLVDLYQEKPWEVPVDLRLAIDVEDEALREKPGDKPWLKKLKRRIQRDPQCLPVLVWDVLSEAEPQNGKVLDDFIQLANARPEQFVKFANKFGVLQVCEHGVPYVHNANPHITGTSGFCQPSGLEPVSLWRMYARLARAIIKVVADLHDVEKPDIPFLLGDKKGLEYYSKRISDWEDIDGAWVFLSKSWNRNDAPDGFFKGFFRDPHGEAHNLAETINVWLEFCGVRPTFSWDLLEEPRHEIRLTGGAVLGSVMRHLAFACARVDGYVTCSGCGNPFVPERRPRVGQRRWCPPCRRGKADVRQAMRDYRKSKGVGRKEKGKSKRGANHGEKR